MLNHLILLSESATAAAGNSNETATVWDKLGLGGSVAVLGMAIVFIGLVLLIFITWLYPKIVKALIPRSVAAKERRKAKKAERMIAKEQTKAVLKEAKAVSPVKTEAVSVGTATQTPADNDPALIAVITAAIAASLGTSSNGIVIRSLRRANSMTPAWGASNRVEQVNNRL